MKSCYINFLTILLIASFAAVHAQSPANSKDLLQNSLPDTNRVKYLLQQAELYYFSKPDSCLILAEQAIELSQKLNFPSGEFKGLSVAGEALRFLGEFPKALEMQFIALQISRSIRDRISEAATMSFIGFTYVELHEYRQALNYFYQAKKIYDGLSDPVMSTFNLSNIGNAYENMNMLDSALYFQQKAHTISDNLAHKNLRILILIRLGIVLSRLGKFDQAFNYHHVALQNAYLIDDKVRAAEIQYRLAESYFILNQEDSSLYYARLAFANSQKISQKVQMLKASNLMVKLFKNKNMPDSVIQYLEIATATKDSLFGSEKFKQLQLLTLNEQQRQQQIRKEQERYKIFALLIMLGFLLIIALILYRNNRHKQKVNLVLEDKKNEIQNALTELKSTQSQLVQREKMASLGELTAGIAHEIQNPLNFVNNFSEVSVELADDLEKEIEEGNKQEVVAIAEDIKENLQKIVHHGKRADAIVKGMLQHSGARTGKKEAVDINALANEYLRLSYHGIRAKDKSFNATTETKFDESIGMVDVIFQDVGRVLLNLFTNAFYSVSEKKKQLGNAYVPSVIVSTKAITPLQTGSRAVEIKVRDNGIGIPQKMLDKIFQPFFSTKPTGQGTGLGLSITYDIIKAHGGEMKVETIEGEFAEFIIILPDTNSGPINNKKDSQDA